MIPEWMDVVVWGNEHECKPRLMESTVGTFRIYQPGSSVGTSMNVTESLRHPKSMGVLEVKAKKFRLSAVPYTQIRPFVFADLSLPAVDGLLASDPRVEEKIQTLLAEKVRRLVAHLARPLSHPYLAPI